MKKILILGLVFVFSLSLVSCIGNDDSPKDNDDFPNYNSGNITGQVVDATDKSPLKEATVKTSSKETTTNSDGNYQIKDVSGGETNVSVEKYKNKVSNNSYKFYYKKESNVTVDDDSVLDIEITSNFEVDNIDYKKEDYTNDYTFSGNLINNTNEKIDYIEINIKLYDENGTRVDDNMTNMTDVEAGENIEWEILTSYDGKFDSYKIDLEYSVY
ncbi:MAG: FxLYD domain-containing protein [bacterium]